MKTEKKIILISQMYQQMMIQYLNISFNLLLNLLERRKKSKKIHLVLLNEYTKLINFVLITTPCKVRSIFKKERSNDWWIRIVPNFDDQQWMENFRMRKDTFQYICNELRPLLEPAPNTLRKSEPVSVEKKVAICLYFLASCAEYRVIGNQFGVHKSTVWKSVHECVDAILHILTPKWIKMPNDTEAKEISQKFNEICHIPNIIGCIDGTHIPITPPSDGYRDFINRKGWPSMVLQAVVDHNYCFRNVCIKNPGSAHDAAVLKSSNLYKFPNIYMPKGSATVGDEELKYVLVGDPAYPLLEWLLKGYINRGLSPEEDSFNVHMNMARVNVEIAFGRLKARWRTLLKRIDVHHTFVPSVTVACCTLHNIVEAHKTTFQEHWLQAIDQAEITFPQPPNTIERQYSDFEPYNMREQLKIYLAAHFPLKSSRLS